MPFDPFSQFSQSSITPAENCFAITPDDLQELTTLTKAIYIGQGGDLTVLTGKSLEPVTFRNVMSGTILDVRVRAVKSTDTTADDLVGLA